MDFSAIRAQADLEWDRLTDLEQPLIQIGLGTCGRASGADAVAESVRRTLEELDIPARIMAVGCIGMCYLEPLLTLRLPDQPAVMYGPVTPENAGAIVTRMLTDGDHAPGSAVCTVGAGQIDGLPNLEEHPMMAGQQRIALRNCGLIDPGNIHHYIARGGYQGLQRALDMRPAEVIEEVAAAGLRGRGGAGFPTARKWELATGAAAGTSYLICNADEGDPGAFMDRALLEGDPHAVLEGMLIGAYAIGAAEGFIYIRAEYPLAISRLEKALQQMRHCGLLGGAVLERPFSFDIHIRAGAGAFVCGEETALIASLHGRRGMPRPRPPFPAQAGLRDRPTVINNVETFANVSAIMERGAPWFAGIGTERSRGTKTFSLAGKIRRTGLIEVPMGTSLTSIIDDIGGGAPDGGRIKGVQTGGPSGGCIPADRLELSVDYESLSTVGSIMGSGGIIVLDERTCMVDLARFFLDFTNAESCGKCLPCRLGTRQLLDILDDICQGRGTAPDLDLLEDLCETIGSGSLCGLGQTAPNPVRTTLRYFRKEYEQHVIQGRCEAGVCKPLFHYEIDPQRCNGCGLCRRACSAGAISGEKKAAHRIDQIACTKCGMCYRACRQQAVVVA